MHRRVVGLRRPIIAVSIGRIAFIEINGTKVAREYDPNNNANYCNHPIIIKDDEKYFISNNGTKVNI